MSLKSKHSVHVCFFHPSPPGSYYQMTIYSWRPLGKGFHKHQNFESRRGHDKHGGCTSQSFWLLVPILVCVPCCWLCAPSSPCNTSGFGSEAGSPGAFAGSCTSSPATTGMGKDSCSLAGRNWWRLCVGSGVVLEEEFHL